MKKYLIKIDIKEYERDIDDPIREVVDYSIGLKLKFRGKEYGIPLICSDSDKLSAIPQYVEAFLEEYLNKEE